MEISDCRPKCWCKVSQTDDGKDNIPIPIIHQVNYTLAPTHITFVPLFFTFTTTESTIACICKLLSTISLTVTWIIINTAALRGSVSRECNWLPDLIGWNTWKTKCLISWDIRMCTALLDAYTLLGAFWCLRVIPGPVSAEVSQSL